MIKICNPFKAYDHQPLFKRLHLAMENESVIALIGHSGSGKSTILRCMNGLEIFQRGCIAVDDQKLYGTNELACHREQEENPQKYPGQL